MMTADDILADIVKSWEYLKRDEGAFPPGDRRAAISEHRLWHSIQTAKAWLRHAQETAPTKWLVEINDNALTVETPDDLRDAILDAYGYPLNLEAHPDLLKVTRYETGTRLYLY